MPDKSAPQRRKQQQERCREMLAVYAAKERKRRRREKRVDPRREDAIAQLSRLIEKIRQSKNP